MGSFDIMAFVQVGHKLIIGLLMPSKECLFYTNSQQMFGHLVLNGQVTSD